MIKFILSNDPSNYEPVQYDRFDSLQEAKDYLPNYLAIDDAEWEETKPGCEWSTDATGDMLYIFKEQELELIPHKQLVKSVLDLTVTQQAVDLILTYDKGGCEIDYLAEMVDTVEMQKIIKDELGITLSFSETFKMWQHHSLDYSAGWLLLQKNDPNLKVLNVKDAFYRYLKDMMTGRQPP